MNEEKITEKVFGIHAVLSLLSHQPSRVSQLLIDCKRLDKRMEEIRKIANTKSCAISEVSRSRLDEISPNINHQGVIAYLNKESKSQLSFNQLLDRLPHAKPTPLIIVLDRITDPRNLGACIRSADAFGATAVIISKHQTASVSPLVSKASSGATVPVVVVSNLSFALKKLQDQGVTCIATVAQQASDIQDVNLLGPVAICLGCEGQGLKQLLINSCDLITTIPMKSAIGSVNVSVACGILCYEVNRQRNQGIA
ncbi:MAG: 23S rRNA (guanosine(2251)-2'-O)-methyltransferase RlmB [Methylacidiphilales bacterium]|nr:23S rRNA (guanosine(2251)-2'-O)-methyltransferase RlmB [Candidatus Methylacidiphilales bacterium]